MTSTRADPSTLAKAMPGVLWITSSIKKTDLPISLFDAWYDEHMNDVLTCPGNGGLFLRYKNINPDADPYIVPTYDDPASPSSVPKPVVETKWPYLALAKLDDVSWVASKQFIDIPRHSKILPREADGSDGSAYTCFHAALRSYTTVGKITDESRRTTRPKYVVTVQSKQASEDSWQTLDNQYVQRLEFGGSVRYRIVEGLLAFPERGVLPEGLVIYEFGCDEPPQPSLDKDALRTDVWELVREAGESSLRL